MTLKKAVFLLLVQVFSSSLTFAQIINTEHKPPSLVFKNADGKVETTIALDTDHAALVLNLKISTLTRTAYVLNATGKSSERSISAVSLRTLQVDHVIDLGPGKNTKMLVSRDGRRLFCYKHTEHADEAGAADSVVVIDTASNSVIRKVGLMHNPHIDLPDAEFIDAGLFATSDGKYIALGVDGFHRSNAGPTWARVVIVPIESPDSAFVINPRMPGLSFRLSPNEKFLFIASKDKDRAETVYIVNLEKGTSINRDIENPPAKGEQLGVFLSGAPPAGTEAKEGAWVLTRTGLRFLSEDGELGKEIPLRREENVAAMASLDRTLLFTAFPNSGENSGVLDVVNLKNGTVSSHPLSEAPRKLLRLGPTKELWMMGHQTMRPISESGEIGDKAIALNKPGKVEAGDTTGAETVLNGDAGEAISLGDDYAAVLITNKKGGTLHRVALLDLKQFTVNSIVTISAQKFSESGAGRFLTALGVAAAEGAVEGVATGLSGTQTNLFPGGYYPGVPGNEALAAQPDGQQLYVLNVDTHELSFVNVQTATVVRRVEVDHSVTKIAVAADHKHLYGVGPGAIQTLDIEPDQKAN